jgi:hypothetical protein
MDAKATAVSGLKGIFRLFLIDLESLPDVAYTRQLGPKTRTVADIVYEVNLVNDHVGMVIRGEEPFSWPEGDWIKAPVGFNTKDKVVGAFKSSSDRFVATAESFTSEQFDETIKTEEGETTRFDRCRFVTLHTWYHSGQLNFIQTLLGDDAWHWD